MPRFLLKKKEPPPEPPASFESGKCEYGLECLKGHMLRAHLYISEALRFSSEGVITPEAQGKVRLARAQLLCEDDFQAAMQAPQKIKLEVLRLLAATRSTWKAIESSGVDMGMGSVDDLCSIARGIESLYNKAYEIDQEFRSKKGTV